MRKGASRDMGNAQERILDAAVEVLAQHGYTGAGVQEIVELSGTSKGSFYFHFPSKEHMVMALVDRMSGKLIRKVQESVQHQPTPLHRITASLDVLIATFARQRKVAQVLLLNIVGHGKATDNKFLPIRERFSGLIQQELDAAVEQRQIETMDTSLISQMWIGALHEVILRWLLTGKPSPLTSATPVLQGAFLRSIGADPEVILACTSAAYTRAPQGSQVLPEPG
ncbi:MAG: TetR/AcrR family transcriptional regulator [Chloroflexi bacterium]|nr:TetR/AcrR family transcriptional regulator [Chloroflexota bacterium]